ncbi:bifunctional phosphopantothenoylcysteine decarboxylase/phosphopantothenate--cysteine ligase CoaBC [candidate division WOR-3 bacterium]|nr:bifunctional phosphopantothenoylcysteine decarboxylase/phosphopantothenate--cysteine ligase CoaBC [candidate division WOR-3 bacterium]
MNERLLLGVSGSIAAYKAPLILRKLTEQGFSVPVVLTRAASRFIGRVTFESLTKEGVYDNLWARRQALSHISLLDGTRLVLVAPATANIIAKAASGIADDLLSSILLAADPGKVLFAPAMNQGMWENPATQENVNRLKKRGANFVEPGFGKLACGVTGEGRLAEPDEIALAAERLARAHPVLADKRIVVTAGRTEEEIDPVRVITNRSSGRMGTELAKAFARRGAEVTLVAGEISVPLPCGVNVIRVRSAIEMLAELTAILPSTDALLMAAAIADYTPVQSASSKLKDKDLSIKITRTPDVLGALPDSSAVLIGFSVETEPDWTKTASEKLSAKNLDAIVANPATVIGGEQTEAEIIFTSGKRMRCTSVAKEVLATKLVEVVAELLADKEPHA